MAKKENYCNGCKFKIETIGTNEKGFCEVGYTQNPVTDKATKNALKNKAVVCSRNKFANLSFRDKGWSMAELLLAHPDSLNESFSNFKHFDVNLSMYLR